MVIRKTALPEAVPPGTATKLIVNAEIITQSVDSASYVIHFTLPGCMLEFRSSAVSGRYGKSVIPDALSRGEQVIQALMALSETVKVYEATTSIHRGLEQDIKTHAMEKDRAQGRLDDLPEKIIITRSEPNPKSKKEPRPKTKKKK